MGPPGPVSDFGLPPPFGSGEAALYDALGAEVLDIAGAPGIAQRDEHVPLIPLPVAIHHHAG